jgi:hypothetical protein|tara:strand:+ start:4049 stop:4240 length:192 start_codon:yes stop_codon:yes gene_type:complete
MNKFGIICILISSTILLILNLTEEKIGFSYYDYAEIVLDLFIIGYCFVSYLKIKKSEKKVNPS